MQTEVKTVAKWFLITVIDDTNISVSEYTYLPRVQHTPSGDLFVCVEPGTSSFEL